MKTLTTPVNTQKAASQSAWCEVFDFYLKVAIVTPWGTISILRITDLVGGLTFFTPKISPEAAGNQGVSQAYNYYPIARENIKADGKFANDKMQIRASNVTTEWVQMLLGVDWYDTPIIIRKVPTSATGLTADDCAIIWAGQVDAVQITEKELIFECSNDLGNLQATAPRENMHRNCRFAWGDDFCTKYRFLAANYKSKTVGSSSTTTVVKSAGLTEDTSTGLTYGTDLVNALLDASITASSAGGSLTNVAVSVALTGVSDYAISLPNHGLGENDSVQFTATSFPGGLAAGVTYYVHRTGSGTFKVKASPSGSSIQVTSSGGGVRVSTLQNYTAAAVKSSNDGYWKIGLTADWGTNNNGFWIIPDAQAGLTNGDLKPYIQFDFGSAKAPRLWQISTVTGVRLEELARLLEFFSSTNAATWKHETYFELPPVGGVLYECQIPNATSARYWRICVRSRWAQTLFFALLGKVYAYEESRHYWANGRITFDAATATVALRGVSRRVRESYSGQVVVGTLPAAPASGDTFVIERGCSRSFNACCARGNWENFGGFLDLPYQSIIR